jgi:hypothetical protein
MSTWRFVNPVDGNWRGLALQNAKSILKSALTTVLATTKKTPTDIILTKAYTVSPPKN